jgi:hypothetical protein
MNFQVVIKKNKKKNTNIILQKLTTKIIIECQELKLFLEEYNPISVILFGSYSRGNYTINSDIDLMFIWKSNTFNKIEKPNLENIKKKIQEIFMKKVDIISMIYTPQRYHYFENDDDWDSIFVNNVYNDGIIIYGDNDKEKILKSIKYDKT